MNDITQIKKKQSVCTNEFVSANRVLLMEKILLIVSMTFFIHIVPSLAKKIQTCQNADYTQCLGNSIANSMYINPVSDDEIVKVVSKFKNKQSCG